MWTHESSPHRRTSLRWSLLFQHTIFFTDQCASSYSLPPQTTVAMTATCLSLHQQSKNHTNKTTRCKGWLELFHLSEEECDIHGRAASLADGTNGQVPPDTAGWRHEQCFWFVPEVTSTPQKRSTKKKKNDKIQKTEACQQNWAGKPPPAGNVVDRTDGTKMFYW